MSNHMPIYSHVVPKSQYRKAAKNAAPKEARPTNLGRGDFDPLNYNSGGQFHLLNAPLDTNPNLPKYDKLPDKKESRRSKEDPRPRRGTTKTSEPNEGKVEAYLRQNQVSIRQQQHRHSAVRQAEHRVNLRSLPLNDVMSSRHDRTPTERHRALPERERDGNREHRRERDKDRDRDEFDGTPLSPPPRDRERVRKSSSSHKVSEPALSTDKRRFFCREWAFQKIAHCLEQRPVSKTCGALILGDAGSGKTALCQEISDPGQGPQARQQRALNRRLLARHFLQSQSESSLRPGEFVRSLAMQILSQSSRHSRAAKSSSPAKQASPSVERRNSEDDRLIRRFKHMGADDGEECSKPLLDSEDQRTDDDEEAREREANLDAMIDDAALSHANELPEILPRASLPPTNPFLTEGAPPDAKIYENHENVFLRNLSQRQSKELRNSRVLRQSSEPSTEHSPAAPRKSRSTEQRDSGAARDERPKPGASPPKSRIPVASFKYPNKSDLRSSSTENSPHKSKPIDVDSKKETESADRSCQNETEDTPEYQNVLKPTKLDLNDSEDKDVEMPEEQPLVTPRASVDDAPPPIPSLPASARTLIANAYYEKLLAQTEIQQALLPQNLEKNPDECFKRALLFPLLEIDPPKQCLFLLVDAIDEGSLTGQLTDKPDSTEPSRTVAVLLARHQHLFPQWLLLACTARRGCKQLTRMFTGFRKITLDELHRAHVSADVQRYVLARLDTEPRLRARVSSDTTAAAAAAAALDHLRIKSDGCLLYLEKVLDGVADGFIALREIREIPGTLNGLYLWLAQRLFHGRRFTKIRLLLDVLLAARCGVTEEMLYRCLLTKEYSVTRDDFNRRLHLLRRILVVERSSGFLSLFHHSFARWLLDVKHCTRRYLCSTREGHAALAMYYTLHAKRLTALEIHNYVLHMTSLEQYWTAQRKSKSGDLPDNPPLDVHSLILLWVLDSGCDVESALSRENDTLMMLKKADCQTTENKAEEKEADPESEGKESSSAIDAIMPELSTGCDVWPRDSRVLRALLELTGGDCGERGADEAGQEVAISPQTETSERAAPGSPRAAPPPPEPGAAHDLATSDAADTLDALLELHPHLVSSLDATGGTPLHCAARNGKAKSAAVLLSHGARPDLPDKDHWSPLRAAAWAGHTEVVEVLLEYGCEVDCVDADNRTALRAAAWSGHEAVVSRLLAAGACPDKPDAEGRTPLIAAAYMGHAEIVRALIDAGAEIDHADEDGRTALAVAALCASGAACATILLERGADVHKPDRDKATPLLVAAFEGHTEICELLLEAEADIEAADVAGRTALWAAASAGHAPTVRLLLFWGACVDNMDNEGRTVLSTAAAQGNVEVVRQLLDRGLDEHHRDNSGWTPLHYAAFEGHVEVCEALLEAGAKVDEADNDGKGPLMLASQEGHSKLVEILLDDWAAPVDQHAHDGKTALRLAALEGHFDCVSALHARGADVDAVDADRRSALYVLALDNRMAMARYLISECGASVDIRDAEGRTPLHVSAWQGHHDMVNLLIKVGGATVDGRDASARTALHAAAWRGRGAALAALLSRGADPSAVCAQGATPLGIAAQEGHEECVLWLLQHGADPLQADHCGRTPAKVAWRAGHANICRLLERWAAPSAPPAPAPALDEPLLVEKLRASPDYKRRSVHSSNSTKSSGNLTGSCHSHDKETRPVGGTQDKTNRANLSLSFAQQVARVGRGRRERERDNAIPENHAVEQDSKLRSYAANERDADIALSSELRSRGYTGYAYERDNMSPLYASPPRSPISDICSPTQPVNAFGSQPPSLTTAPPSTTDQHFNRDTHMRIILGRDTKPPPESRERSSMAARSKIAYGKFVGSLGRARGRVLKRHKNKRNGIVTNPAMRLVANVRNGLDNAAANIRRTGVALAASASSNNPAVKTNAFQWRKETPL